MRLPMQAYDGLRFRFLKNGGLCWPVAVADGGIQNTYAQQGAAVGRLSLRPDLVFRIVLRHPANRQPSIQANHFYLSRC